VIKRCEYGSSHVECVKRGLRQRREFRKLFLFARLISTLLDLLERSHERKVSPDGLQRCSLSQQVIEHAIEFDLCVFEDVGSASLITRFE
jgi:succinylglutamate desuccinylase